MNNAKVFNMLQEALSLIEEALESEQDMPDSDRDLENAISRSMNLILARLVTLAEGETFATMGPLTPFWFESLPPDMQERTRTTLIPVEAVNVGPYLDELWGGWVLTCYDANNDVILSRRCNDLAIAEEHKDSLWSAA